MAFAGCAGGASIGTPATQRPADSASIERAIGTPRVALPSSDQLSSNKNEVWRYVALGDSYTIGTSVKPRERWPNQLVRTLRPGADVTLVQNLATNGATTADLLAQQVPAVEGLDPNIVSLLVGVNDVVRGVDVEAYRTNVRSILKRLVGELPASHVVVVTTPDYTLTSAGSNYGERSRQAARIKAFNTVLQAEASRAGTAIVDITPLSDLVPGDPTLVASDGLHPSGKQYAGWVELIAPQFREVLTNGT
jgi:lysophospholipase L1-like esterase